MNDTWLELWQDGYLSCWNDGSGQTITWDDGCSPSERPLTRPELLELAAEIMALAGSAPEGGEA